MTNETTEERKARLLCTQLREVKQELHQAQQTLEAREEKQDKALYDCLIKRQQLERDKKNLLNVITVLTTLCQQE